MGTLQDLIDSLREICRCYGRLALLLEREREQIKTFDAHAILRTVAEKGTALTQLARARDSARAQVTELLESEEENLPLEELIGRVPLADPLQKLWQELLPLNRSVHILQERNRALIGEGLAFCEETLASLQKAMHPAPSAYGPVHKGWASKPAPTCLRREV